MIGGIQLEVGDFTERVESFFALEGTNHACTGQCAGRVFIVRTLSRAVQLIEYRLAVQLVLFRGRFLRHGVEFVHGIFITDGLAAELCSDFCYLSLPVLVSVSLLFSFSFVRSGLGGCRRRGKPSSHARRLVLNKAVVAQDVLNSMRQLQPLFVLVFADAKR